MIVLDLLAAQRIREAQVRGAFDALPGAGRPLDLDEPPLVPDDVRMANRILKNAGFVPPEVELRRERHDASRSVAEACDDTARAAALRKLHALELRIAAARPGARIDVPGACIDVPGARIDVKYRERVLARFESVDPRAASGRAGIDRSQA